MCSLAWSADRFTISVVAIQSWREVVAGSLATAGFVLLVFPLSLATWLAVLLAVLAYVALRLLLHPTPGTIEAPAKAASVDSPIDIEPEDAQETPALPGAKPASSRRDPLPFGLTPREMEILPLLAQRKTNDEIAGRLFKSEKTVMNQVASILGKLGLKSRRQVGAFLEQHRDLFQFPPQNGDR